jgi:hypothetical protein
MATIHKGPDGKMIWTCGQCGKESTQSTTPYGIFFPRVCNCPDAADMTSFMREQVKELLERMV